MDKKTRLHTFCHAVKGKWHLSGVVLSAGGSLKWYRDNLAQEIVEKAAVTNEDPYNLILKGSETVSAGADGLFFLPYLSGERTPYPDPDAKGVFIGLSMKHTKNHMARSVIEGITFAMRDSLELIKINGVSIDRIISSGGGSKNRYWRKIQSDIYGHPVSIVNAEEGPAFGVALLAATATGEYSTIEEACSNTIKVTETIEPESISVEKYNNLYKFYNSLYPVVAPKFKEIAALF